MSCLKLAIISASAIAASALAQTRPTGPIMGPLPPEGPLVITIVEVGGNVSVRNDPDSPWRKAEPGETLPEGAEARTGVRSFIKLKIGDEQLATLDRLSTYKLLKANFESGVYQTDVAVKYGRMKYEIEAAGRVHDATVRSATSTLAVRGTVFEIYDQPPFTPQAISYDGRVMVRDIRKQISIGGRGAGKVVVDGDKDSAAATALATASFDPSIDSARTPAEQRLIEQVISTGGIVRFDDPVGIPVVTGGTPILYSPANASTLPGTGLNFVLNWSGNSDLNLSQLSPLSSGLLVAPVAPLNRVQTGGITAYDHRGGANGGFEIVFFGDNYPGSNATLPPGGFTTVPGPVVTDPVSGVTRPTVRLVPPTQRLSGGEDYVSKIGFVSGQSTPYSLQIWVKDPLTNQNELIAGTFGDFTVDPQTGRVSATKTEVLYRAPVGLPDPSDQIGAINSSQSRVGPFTGLTKVKSKSTSTKRASLKSRPTIEAPVRATSKKRTPS